MIPTRPLWYGIVFYWCVRSSPVCFSFRLRNRAAWMSMVAKMGEESGGAEVGGGLDSF